MNQLRVLRITSVFDVPDGSLSSIATGFDPVGGMQGHTAALTRELDQLGVAQTVLTTCRPRVPAENWIGEAGHVRRVGVPIKRFRQLWALPAARLARRISEDVDLIHVHLGEDIAAIPIALSAARARRLPVVITVHCSLRHTLRVLDARTAVLAAVGGLVEGAGVRRAARVITLTNSVAERLARAGIDRTLVHTIPPGVDKYAPAEPFERPLPNLTGPRVVFVGRLARQKGLKTLIEAARLLRNPEARIILVGDGPDRPFLEWYARELGVAERVRFVGFVRPARVSSFLAHADVFVLPSVYEELGRSLIEAMSMGVPVVASRTGGISELVTHGKDGLLIEPGNPRRLATAVDLILGDKELARKLGDGARSHTFPTWREAAERVLDVYGHALATREWERVKGKA